MVVLTAILVLIRQLELSLGTPDINKQTAAF
jgi:hypothetical protein